LKQMMYREVREHRRADTILTHFMLRQSTRVTFAAELSIEDQKDLVGMTPMRYRGTRSLTNEAHATEMTHVTFDFWIDVFEKHE